MFSQNTPIRICLFLLVFTTVLLLCGCIKGPDFPYYASPRAITHTPENPASGNIAIAFQLIDREKEPGNTILEYSINAGASFNPAALVNPSETQNLQSDWYPGIIHTVRWNSPADMVGRWGDSSVIVKVTPSDASNPSGGTPGISDAFVVNNIAYMSIIYVDGTNGSDTNDGLSWSTAKKTIQAGINAAVNDWGVLVADVTYTGTGNKDLDFKGKAIYLKSVGGAENCIIDCENSGRGFYFHSSETAEAIVEGFTIRNGSSNPGGGILCVNYSSPRITNCTIANNSVSNDGGGIDCEISSNAAITNCIIVNNRADFGGAIRSCFANPSIINCLIANNSTHSGGAGICSTSGSLTITNCTITNNRAETTVWGYGGGIMCDGSSIMVNNTIIWGNSAAASGNQIITNTSSVTLNYCYYGNGANDVAGPGTITPNNCINDDPLFVDSANGNYRLQGTSPCIDAGDNSLVPAGVTTDLDGNPRIHNGTVDIGAYEYQP
jgi:hypothetical protein